MLEHRDARRQRGFTLAEVMVATAIFAVIVIAALMIYDRSNRVFKESVEAAGMQQETRVAFDKLVRDVRMAGFDFDRDGVPMISTPTIWTAATTYAQNKVVIPTTPNGFVYIAVNGGQSHTSEPTNWSTTVGEITVDNTVRWRAVQAVYQQPDEQIEYAGLSAITIRGNLDYTTDATNEHGRENYTDTTVPTYNYEPTGDQFPIVTTGNDEIVTYALKSDRPGAPNDDEIHFFADVSRPRTAYPGAGGAAESEVVIEGVDLCDDVRNGTRQCIYPPYTLYRFTISPDGEPDAGTPVASNIRSLKFFYYTNQLGGVTDANADGLHDELLTAADGALIDQGAIGGLGQYDPNNVGGTANFGDRGQRETIQSIRVQLIGMNAVSDSRYTNPAETGNPEALHYRTYQLESLIVPRNAGLRGMQEPVSTTPTPPHIKSICHGYCKATRVTWDPPVSGGVNAFEVRYGTSWSTSNRALPNLARFQDGSPARVPGDQLVAYVILPAPPSGQQWYVNVRAYNEHGIQDADNALRSYGSINKTKPAPVEDLDATGLTNTDYEPNRITLKWPRVRFNDSTNSSYHTLTCTTGGDTNGIAIPSQENIKYRIWRSTNPDFDPTAGQGVIVLDYGSSNNPPITGSTTQITWTDDASSIFGQPPANCTRYYYRIQAYDDCRVATENDPANARLGESTIFPEIGDPGIEGYAGYRSPDPEVVPAAPTGFRIDGTTSGCRVGPNDCSIVLVWNRVTTDTATPTPNTISVEKYYIERQRKTGPTGTWESTGTAALSDPEFEGQSLTTGATITFTDTTAEHHVAGNPTPATRYYYKYRVRAMNCDAVSDWTAFEDYPDLCPTGSTPLVTGGPPEDGVYQMNAGDYVQITPASGVTLTRVDFQLIDVSVDPPVAVSSTSVSSPPYVFPWEAGMPDDVEFKLAVTVVQSTGCVEEFEFRLQEDPGLCPAVTRTVTGSNGGAGIDISPYVMNAGDQIELTGPADVTLGTLSSVSFQLFEADGTTAIGAPVVVNTPGPFVYTWADRTDGATYRLRPTITFTSPDCFDTLADIFITDETCIGASTTPAGQITGDGLTSTTPWVMASGATITVNPATGTTPQRVVFTVEPFTPSGPAEPSVSVGAAPWRLTWADRVDDTVYRVTINVIYSAGCQESLIRYVKDDPQSCKLQVDDPNGTILSIANPDGDATASLILRNQGTASMVLTSLAITWNRWDAGITWDDVTFPSGDVDTINSTTSSTQTIDLSALTSAEKTIAAGNAMTLLLHFTMSGNRDPMELSDITKVCVTYTRADTGTRVYACRILNYPPPDAHSNNPTSCE